MKKAALTTFFAFFFIFPFLQAQSGDQRIKSLQSKFNSITDLSADFHQTSNGKTVLSGKFYYGKGNKIKLDLKNLTIVTDGKTSWSYNKREKKVVISNYDPTDPSIVSLERIINYYPSRCKITLDKSNNTEVINLVPVKTGLSFKNARIYINAQDLIDKIEMTDNNNNQINIDFTNIQVNKDLSSTAFTFAPPKGSKVIDLR